MRTKQDFIDFCERHGACGPGLAWVGAQPTKTAQGIWDRCKRPDWMLWFARHCPQGIDKRTAVQLAVVFARSVVQFVPAGAYHPLAAIEAAEGWLAGTVTEAQAREVGYQARRAYAAADAVDAATAATAAAVDAATAATAAAATAAAVDAAAAATAAAVDAATAATAAAATAAAYAEIVRIRNEVRAETQREFCNVIRKAIPGVPQW